MAREGVEITPKRGYVQRQVRRGLGAVEQHRDAAFVRQADDLGRRRDRTERVGDMGHRDQPGARPQQRGVGVELELAGVVDRHDLDREPELVAQQLPGHDVRVVLHVADDDLVAGLEAGADETVATRLIASVAPRTNTISRDSAAPTSARTFSRAASKFSVARWLR